MRPFGRVALLTSIWVLLWGRISVANVASGILLSIIVLVLYPPPQRAAAATERHVLRPLAALHLAGHIVVQVLISNLQISRQILSPRSRLSSGVVTYEFRTESQRLITFISSVLAISPGTMPVQVEIGPPRIAVHVLDLRDPATTRRAIARLEELTMRAFRTRDPKAVAT